MAPRMPTRFADARLRLARGRRLRSAARSASSPRASTIRQHTELDRGTIAGSMISISPFSVLGPDADRSRMQVAHAGKGFQEDVMVGRIVGDHHHARARRLRAVGVGLERRIPEILRKMMLAHREAQIRRRRIRSESQRERQLDRRSVGLFPSRAKSNTSKSPMPAASNARASPRAHCCCRGSASKNPRARARKSRLKAPNENEPRAVRHDLLGFGDFEDFDVAVLQLHNAVMRAPRMAVARADGEAGAAIESPPPRRDRGRRARYGRDRGAFDADSPSNGRHFTDEKRSAPATG